MTKDILRQYIDLRSEIKEVRARIEKTEEQIRKMEEDGSVIDTVSGGEGGIQRYRIEGFPYPEYSRKKTLLYTRRTILANLEMDLVETINGVEEFITSVEDSRMRRIIDLRFLQGLSWQQVASRIGGNTEASVKMYFQRFMKKK
jgi:cell division protein FtsB